VPGRFQFGGVDEGEEVSVAVEEGAVHARLPGDAGHADRGVVTGRALDGREHSLPTPFGVGLAAVGHGGVHAGLQGRTNLASRFVPVS
jgi:hypothetical protein